MAAHALSRICLPLLGLAALALLAAAASGSAASPGCQEFSSQGDAQTVFIELGGSPGHAVGSLDPDRDGIACEGLPAPYAGHATIGYNRAGGFLFGTASMPAAASGEERFPCLQGNRRGPEGPRRLSVYRAQEGDDRPVLTGIGAEARPESGRLVWKAPRATIVPGRYYVAFAEAIPLTPYGRSQCPGFRSRQTWLPRPSGLSR
ncbi:MAG TPA: hypothetical protein VGO36_02745 [Solirubrobacterales bacterium]|jgi:hypothetical protein|nr:hypothetical protein [Solirubrobacterales bacterium]